jgi:uncharacterized protein (TIGR03435 family)
MESFMADNREGSPIEVLVVLVSASFLGVVAVPNALAQAVEVRPVFETAVVKAYTGDTVGCPLGPGMLQFTCYGTLPELTGESLGLSPFQLQKSGPAYKITAKLSKPAKKPQRREMLRNFLADKLQVVYHLEKREMAARFLSVEHPELLAKATEAPAIEEFSPSGEWVQRLHFNRLPNGDQQIVLNYASLKELALFLSVFRIYGGPVVDETQEAKRFDFEFFIRAPLSGSGDGKHLDDSDLTQLLKRIGVRAGYRKGLVDYLIIDQVAPEATFLN